MNVKSPRSKRYRVAVGTSAGIVVIALLGWFSALIGGSHAIIASHSVILLAVVALFLWTRQRTDL